MPFASREIDTCKPQEGKLVYTSSKAVKHFIVEAVYIKSYNYSPLQEVKNGKKKLGEKENPP